MKTGLTMTRDNLGSVIAGIRSLTESQCLVGVPAAEAYRKPEPGEKVDPINNAALAYIHENGAPEVNIPARPFLVPGVEAVESEIAARYEKAAQDATAGRADVLDKAHHAVGITAVNSVRRTLTTGDGFAPLAPSTLAKRRARGRKGTKPLIDTAQLRNAQAYVIRKPGEGAE